MLEIKDEGPGISKADQKKIFQPFCKITQNMHLNPKSNGLGLSICRSLSQKMGGNIVVFSDGKNGTTFRFMVQLACPHKFTDLSDTEEYELRKRELGIASVSVGLLRTLKNKSKQS